jgi:hypothetical protein
MNNLRRVSGLLRVCKGDCTVKISFLPATKLCEQILRMRVKSVSVDNVAGSVERILAPFHAREGECGPSRPALLLWL